MKHVLKKLFALIITLFIVSLLAFLAFSVIPGDPTSKILGMEASPEQIEALRIKLGLDRPVLIRYWEWLTAFLRGDFGTSYSYDLPVGEMLADKLNTGHPHISRIESGKKSASIDMLVEIAVLFNVSLDYLVLGRSSGNTSVQQRIHTIITQLEQIEKEL